MLSLLEPQYGGRGKVSGTGSISLGLPIPKDNPEGAMKWVPEVGWMGGAYLGRFQYCPWGWAGWSVGGPAQICSLAICSWHQ